MINVFCSVSAREIQKLEAWLIPSLVNQRPAIEISLTLVNYSGTGRVYDGPSRIGTVEIVELSDRPFGFGEAHNFAFFRLRPEDFFIIANPDVYCHQACISELIDARRKNPDAALIEARQLPFEHPKEYDPKTGYTPWASGFFLLIDSAFFKKTGGFDENFWMYCEDVDLSWRAWLNDKKVLYCPGAAAYHFTGAHFEYEKNRYYLEHFWGARNFLYLAHKFWGGKTEKKAVETFLRRRYPGDFKREVMASFEELKSSLAGRRPVLSAYSAKEFAERIKITGFNLYHRERSAQ